MRGLRTGPVLLDVCRDMEELCPDAHLLNYVNPMAMNCWALSRATPIRTIGLCHSVQGTAEQPVSYTHLRNQFFLCTSPRPPSASLCVPLI